MRALSAVQVAVQADDGLDVVAVAEQIEEIPTAPGGGVQGMIPRVVGTDQIDGPAQRMAVLEGFQQDPVVQPPGRKRDRAEANPG